MKNPDTRRKFYKDGNPELYKSFSELAWKNMTAKEKEMWTPAEENEEAAIPKEVLDFAQKNSSVITKDKEIDELKERVSILEAENEALQKQCEDACKRPEPTRKKKESKESIKVDTEETKVKLIQEELRKMGVKFAWNAKLDNLQAKLDKAKKDAANTK